MKQNTEKRGHNSIPRVGSEHTIDFYVRVIHDALPTTSGTNCDCSLLLLGWYDCKNIGEFCTITVMKFMGAMVPPERDAPFTEVLLGIHRNGDI